MRKRPSSSSTQLQIWTPEKKREPLSRSRLNLAIVPLPQDAPTTFNLPEDWVVEERKRSNGTLRGNTDKYYHEPGTGRVFRSLVSVKRYLMETGDYEITSKGDIKLKMPRSDVTPLSIALPGCSSKPYVAPSSLKSRSPVKKTSSLKSRSPVKTTSHKSASQIVVKTTSHKSASQIVVYRKSYIPKHRVNIDRRKPLKLPDGWYVKRITRASGHSMGRVDKYYCERATGRVFRSKLDVKRYLADNYIEENTTLSELFKPAGLIQMSGSEEQDVDEDGDMAIVPHSGNDDSYSDISDDVPLKDLVRKHDDVPLKDLAEPLKDFDVPLKDLDPEAGDVPLKDLVWKSDDVSPKDFDQKSDDVNVPLKDLVRKSSVRRKTSKHVKKLASPTKPASSPTKPASSPTKLASPTIPTSSPTKQASPTKVASSTNMAFPTKDVFSCTINTSPVNASKPPMKIKWVLSGPGGDEWSPFTGDSIVPESLKQEWAQLFIDIVSQKHSEASSSDALE